MKGLDVLETHGAPTAGDQAVEQRHREAEETRALIAPLFDSDGLVVPESLRELSSFIDGRHIELTSTCWPA